MSNADVRPVQLVVAGSFLLSTALALLLLLRSSDLYWAPTVGACVAAALGLRALAPLLQRRGLPIHWLVLVALLNLCLVVPELALRAGKFQFESGVQFGYPRPSHFVRYAPDAELFWRLRTPAPGVNSLGFPGDEFTMAKPAGVFRVLFLGDSVTYQGYPALVEGLLERAYPDRAFESIPLAVPGYSSHQGRVLAEKYGRELEPDAVVVYFGWNDHWLAYGSTDAEKRIEVPTGWREQLARAHRTFRILQATQWLAGQMTGTREERLAEPRVPPGRYRENLEAIRDVFAARDVPVIFITAPTSFYRLGVPDYLVDSGFLTDKNSGLRLHAAYNRIVREHLRGEDSVVLDLDEELSHRSPENLRALFLDDGIHLTPVGSSGVAERVVAVLRPYVQGVSPRADAVYQGERGSSR